MNALRQKVKQSSILIKALSPNILSGAYFFFIYWWVSIRKKMGFKAKPISLKIFIHGKELNVLVFDPTDFAVMKEVFVDEEYKLGSDFMPQTILDIGSNVGYSVLYFKTLFPDVVIHAYEPEPNTFLKMKKNMEGHPGITLHNKAIADVSGEMSFFVYPGSSMSSSFFNRTGTMKEIAVNALTLDEAIANTKSNVSFIKCDAEGAEFALFAVSQMRTHIPRIIAEVHEDLSGKPLSDFIAFFPQYTFSSQPTGKKRFIIDMVQSPHDTI